jgi:Sulfotransferase domain
MKVIGAGLPRTGTLSQKVALEMLGFGPCYHMVNVLGDLDLAAHWRAAVDGNADWDETFEGFESTVDWPGSFFYKELAEKYPDAKVVLGTRDGDAWVRSMRETIWGVFYGDGLVRHLSGARATIDPKWASYLDMMDTMWKRSGLMVSADQSDEEMAAGVERYHEEVKQNVPEDRLLVWSVGEGWDRLCDFLEVPVPDTPFPHLNEKQEFQERLIDGSLLVLNAWRERERDGQPVAAGH